MKEFKTSLDSFIGGWYIDEKICDDLIDYYNLNKKKTKKGSIIRNNKSLIDTDKKDCTQISIDYMYNSDVIAKYRKQLQICLENYVERYSEVKDLDKFNVLTNYNIQHYKPNQGFKIWHHERNTSINANRVLVFMTYLNNTDGGTEFKYQKLTTPCKKGLTLIWPTDWTHTHRGQISKKQEKYIVTGWYDYIQA